MTDTQAELGLSQLKRIDKFVIERHHIVNQCCALLKELDFILPRQQPDSYSAFHLYVVRVKKTNPVSHLEIFERLKTNGIIVNLHYITIHQPFYKNKGFDVRKFPNV